MAIRYTVHEIVSELSEAIKLPMDPATRKLLKKTIATLNNLIDYVGSPEVPQSTPSLVDRIKESE